MNCTAWLVPIGRPKASLVGSSARTRPRPCASPGGQRAAIAIRPSSRIDRTARSPGHAPDEVARAGTRTSTKDTSRVSEASQPTFLSARTRSAPGVPAGTGMLEVSLRVRRVCAGPASHGDQACDKSVTRVLMKALVPLMTHSSPFEAGRRAGPAGVGPRAGFRPSGRTR